MQFWVRFVWKSSCYIGHLTTSCAILSSCEKSYVLSDASTCDEKPYVCMRISMIMFQLRSLRPMEIWGRIRSPMFQLRSLRPMEIWGRMRISMCQWRSLRPMEIWGRMRISMCQWRSLRPLEFVFMCEGSSIWSCSNEAQFVHVRMELSCCMFTCVLCLLTFYFANT
jgi:hypothetical protein